MKRTALFLSLALVMLAAATVGAQRAAGPAADPSAAFDVAGTVVAFTAAYGSGMPTLRVDDASLGEIAVAMGPIWYLNQEGFAAAAGDQVHLLAYPCQRCPVGQVAAWVVNDTTGVSITLRDDEGYPLWRGGPGSGQGNGSGQGGGHGRGHGHGRGGQGSGTCPNGWAGPDMAAAVTVDATVVSVDAEPGAGTPTVVINADGDELTILVSPYRLLVASGLVLEEGSEISITYAPVTTDTSTHLVAISITDLVSGVTAQLRDPETGFPLIGGHGRGRGHGWGRGSGGQGQGSQS